MYNNELLYFSKKTQFKKEDIAIVTANCCLLELLFAS